MSFSSLVQDMSLRTRENINDGAANVGASGTAGGSVRRPRGDVSTSSAADDGKSRVSHISRAMSYASTAATSVSISGEISSQLHGGYNHPLARTWQADRQLTKVCFL